MINFKENRFNGIYLEPEDLSKIGVDGLHEFEKAMVDALEFWCDKNAQVAWITLSSKQAVLLPILYDLGFYNHHSKPSQVTVVKRLKENALIPDYATHSVGVGGLVINDNQEILTIRELGHVKKYPHNWKFPGGMLEPREHIETGVIREVFEETNIRTTFKRLLGFRHHHTAQFDTSNIYAVCLLEPQNTDIKIQETEIFDAKWFPINEYLADERIGNYNKLIIQQALTQRGLWSAEIPNYNQLAGDYEIYIPSESH